MKRESVKVVFGSPIFTKSGDNIDDVTAKTMQEIKKLLPEEGSPDGMTVDKNKNLWVAYFNGACISVFNKKAKLIHKIKFPAKNVTNCAFGGEKNCELFVTTARKGMSKGDIQKFSYSGHLFSVKTNTKGILQKKFIFKNEKKRSLL